MKSTPTTARHTAPSPPEDARSPDDDRGQDSERQRVVGGGLRAQHAATVSITPASPAAVPLIANVRMRIAVDAYAGQAGRLGVPAGRVHVAARTSSSRAAARAATTATTISPDRRPDAEELGLREVLPNAVLSKSTSRFPPVTSDEQPLTMNAIASVAISELIRSTVDDDPVQRARRAGRRRSPSRIAKPALWWSAKCAGDDARRTRRSRRPRGRSRRRRGRASRPRR